MVGIESAPDSQVRPVIAVLHIDFIRESDGAAINQMRLFDSAMSISRFADVSRISSRRIAAHTTKAALIGPARISKDW
jgi:hypothetical protein